MKYFTTLIALLFIVSIEAKESEEFKSFASYQVVKDTINRDVHKDSCLITGLVHDYDKTPLKGAVVNTIDMKFKTVTDSIGRYRMMIPRQETAIFFFKPMFNEVITKRIDFKGGHEVVVYFDALSDNFQLIMDKPVVYLYSVKELDVRLVVEPKGSFLFTYPKYNSGWDVELSKEGHLMVEGKKYPYLFWEAETNDLTILKKDGVVLGEVVKKENVVTFLEDKLSEIGLNFKEKADFITYWAPRMMKEEEYLVQFVIDEAYEENIASINVTPKPDAMKRIYMLYQKAEVGMELVKQHFTPLERKGFTLVEWGGTELPNQYVSYQE